MSDKARDAVVMVAVLLVVAVTGFFVYRLLFPSTPDAPVPSATWSLPGSSSAGTYSGSDYGDNDPRIGQEPSNAEAKKQAEARGMRPPTTGPLFQIPELGIWAPVVKGPSDKRMILPYSIYTVAAATSSASLDATKGTTVLSGHVGAGPVPGALHELAKVNPGQVMTLRDRAGRTTTWKAVRLQVVDADAIPAALFTKQGPRRLVVITCAGTWTKVGNHREYAKRLIVTAIPA